MVVTSEAVDLRNTCSVAWLAHFSFLSGACELGSGGCAGDMRFPVCTSSC